MIDVLIVKTSSLGDVVHALPVLTDIQRVHPDWKLAWMVEEAFVPLPRLHAFCGEVIPVATRRWRKSWLSQTTRQEWSHCRERLHALKPRYVLDLQGLMKSAVLARLSPGVHLGYRWGSARENISTWLYDQGFSVPWNLHAVERNRRLAAQAFHYDIESYPCDYGVHLASSKETSNQVLLIHSSSWETKLWPEDHWLDLGRALTRLGYECLLPSGSLTEWERAQRLAQHIPQAKALPPGPLEELITHFDHVAMVVGVDTGLTHLATACGLTTVALYTVTDPAATGVYGSHRALNMGGKNACPSVDEVLASLTRLGGLSAS